MTKSYTRSEKLREYEQQRRINSLTSESGIETDPIYSASVAATITAEDKDQWETAYGWGNHSGLYAPVAHVGATGAAHGVATTLVNGFMSGTDKTKLDGVEAGAQVNAVSSVFTRTGAVVAASGDYTATQVTNTPAGNIAATTVQAAINELDSEKQPLDATLTALAGLNADVGMVYQTASDTFTKLDPGILRYVYNSGVRLPRSFASNPDFNTILSSGAYNFDAPASANRPATTMSWVFLEVYRHVNVAAGSEYVVQVCYDMNAHWYPRTWIRRSIANSWGSWLETTPLGVGQSWQSVSRALGVTYTNTTGRPIMVQVTGINGAGPSSIQPTVSGVALGLAQSGAANYRCMTTFVVPAGHTYVVTNVSGATLNQWLELY